MPLKLRTLTAPKPQVIDLGDAGSFTVNVRRPTWDEQMADEGFINSSMNSDVTQASAAISLQVENRLKSVVTGWDGLTGADDQPIPFSWEALKALCLQFPRALVLLERVSNQLFNGVPEADAKNFDSAPSVSSVETLGLPTASESSPSSVS